MAISIIRKASLASRRCIGMGLAARGARVAFLARRRERLENAAREAGHGAMAAVCDVTDADSCHRAVTQVVDEFDGLDALVFTTGMGTLAALEDITAQQWAQLFAINVTGASLVTAAAAKHLAASAGTAVYLSSLSASYTTPWPLLGAYAVSKAALDDWCRPGGSNSPASHSHS
jgi:NAD(P)-dependent dehydrogenase (short-subunit alcohol dehydrogenase family)